MFWHGFEDREEDTKRELTRCYGRRCDVTVLVRLTRDESSNAAGWREALLPWSLETRRTQIVVLRQRSPNAWTIEDEDSSAGWCIRPANPGNMCWR
jgi:hypothetical protein